MTEKQYAPTAKEKKMSKADIAKAPVAAPVKKEEKKTDIKAEEIKTETAEEKKAEAKEEKKTEAKKSVEKVKRDVAVVNINGAKVSLKYAIEICRFIKNKRIGDAIRDLEEVIVKKKHVPMRGEYAHKHGKGKVASGAGKYPVGASEHFIVYLKSLSGNATQSDMNEPYVAEASANKAPKPMGRFGRWERKRCHIRLVAKELKAEEKKKTKNKKQEKKK